MPVILRIGPYRFYFYSNESGEPPHVHIDSGSESLKIWLNDVQLARNIGFSAKEINKLIKLVKEHQNELLRAWNEYFSD